MKAAAWLHGDADVVLGWIVPNFIGETDALGEAGGERLSGLEMTAMLQCCFQTLAPVRGMLGHVGQFLLCNPMDTVMALRRNVVMGKC